MAKTKYISGIALAAMAMAGAGCSDEVYKVVDGVIYSQEPIGLIVNYGYPEMYFGYDGGESSMQMEAGQPWRASGMADWVTLSPDQGGSGISEVRVGVDANDTPDTRINVVNFALTSISEVNSNFTITQDATVPYIELDSYGPYDASAEAQTIEIPFTSNIPMEYLKATLSDDSYTASIEAGADGKYVKVDLPEYTGYSTWSTVVLVLSAEYDGSLYSKSREIQRKAATASADNNSTYNLDAKAQSFEFPLVTPVSWFSYSNVDWITTTPESGAGGAEQTVKVNVEANSSSSMRSATVYIYAGTLPENASPTYSNTCLLSFDVIQQGVSASGSVDGIEAPSEGFTTTLSFNSDVDWVVKSTDYVSVAPASGKAGTTEVKIDITPNYSFYTRRSDITFLSAESSTYLLSIPVTQQSPTFYIDGGQGDEIILEAVASTKMVSLISTMPWTVGDLPSWLSVDPSSANSGNMNLNLTVEENPSTSPRSGTLNLKLMNGENRLSALVTQKGKSLAGDGDIMLSWAAQSHEVEINIDEPWTAAVSNSTWMQLSSYSGSGLGTIELIVSENLSDEARSGSILISTSDRSETVNVLQSGQYIIIDGPASEVANRGGDVQLTVTTSVGAEVSVDYIGDDKDWLSYTVAEGATSTDPSTYTISVSANPNAGIREAEFIVSPGADYDGGYFTGGVKYVIRQAGRNLEVSQPAVYLRGAGTPSATVTINADGDYTVTRGSSDTWFSLRTIDGGFVVTATDNNTGATRRGTVTVSLSNLPAGQEKKIDVQVVQSDQNMGFDYDDYNTDQFWK